MTVPHRCDVTRAWWHPEFSLEEIERCAKEGGLLSMELELSRICNLRCLYCYAKSGEKIKDELTFEEILGAVDQAVALGARRIIVLGGGEPTMYPRLFDVLDHIHATGAEIELFTNGTRIDAAAARRLAELNVAVVIKRNSSKASVQDALAGRPGTFDAIEKGLKHLADAGYPGPGRPMGAQTVICADNIDELPMLWTQLREECIVPYFETLTMQGRACDHCGLDVSPARLRLLFEELARIDQELFGLEWTPRPPVAAFTCRRHQYSCTVTANGDIVPCPGVYLSVGNIREKSLADILTESKVIKDLRNIRKTIKGACRDCDQAVECYGCRGMAYQATGDYLEADPLCWRCDK